MNHLERYGRYVNAFNKKMKIVSLIKDGALDFASPGLILINGCWFKNKAGKPRLVK